MFLWRCRFSEYSVLLPFYLINSIVSTLYVFFPDDVFLPCDHGLDLDISLLYANLIKTKLATDKKRRYETHVWLILRWWCPMGYSHSFPALVSNPLSPPMEGVHFDNCLHATWLWKVRAQYTRSKWITV